MTQIYTFPCGCVQEYDAAGRFVSWLEHSGGESWGTAPYGSLDWHARPVGVGR